jgi:hypothetical protein
MVVAVLLLASGGALVGSNAGGTAAAAQTTSVTLGAGPYSNGETITVSGTGFPTRSQNPSGLSIIECADAAGSTANLPTDDTTCDATTVNPLPVLTDSSGSFSTSYTLASLSPPSSAITCDATDFCVLWVGEDYVNSFQSNFGFSTPFEIGSSTTTTTGATTTTTGATTTTTGATTTTTGATTTTTGATTTTTGATTTTTGATTTTTGATTTTTGATTTTTGATTTTTGATTTTTGATTTTTGATTTTTGATTTTTPTGGTPTAITSSLSGGGQQGGTVVVPWGTAVSDQATLSGPNAFNAGGTVDYLVYSLTFSFFHLAPFADSSWGGWWWEPIADGGQVTVSSGSVPASNAVTFGSGVYFWQALYSGDSLNDPSAPTDGVATEIMLPPPPCPMGLSWMTIRCLMGQEGNGFGGWGGNSGGWGGNSGGWGGGSGGWGGGSGGWGGDSGNGGGWQGDRSGGDGGGWHSRH